MGRRPQRCRLLRAHLLCGAALAFTILAGSPVAAQSNDTVAESADPRAASHASGRFVAERHAPLVDWTKRPPFGSYPAAASGRVVTTSEAWADINFGAGFREAVKMGLVGAAAGAVAGMLMELLDPDGAVVDIWPVALAVPGLVGGVVLSVVN